MTTVMCAASLTSLAKYQGLGPRYTSYPTADRFSESFGATQYAAAIARHVSAQPRRELSIYVHLPFCSHLCFYCACTKIVTKNKSLGERYLRYLFLEIGLQRALFGEGERVQQMHWGGGTPTFFDLGTLRALNTRLRGAFNFASDGEYGIEIDPRTVAAEDIFALRELGFNRVSLGVQDFDEAVQRAVHRVQPKDQTLSVIEATRQAHFQSVSVDLIYGLPRQTLSGFDATLDAVLEANPDRIALYSYAHLPQAFYAQTRIREIELPSTEEKLEIMYQAITRLLDAGYLYIGMDHFARPGDELSIAMRNGALQRNFQGYSTHADCELLALGVSGIGSIADTYSQNFRTLEPYYDALDRGVLPIMRGHELSVDDRLRHAVIQSLMCRSQLRKQELVLPYGIEFDAYFARELSDLRRFEDEGLVELHTDSIRVTERGRFVIRSIAMVFDRYLRSEQPSSRYSKVI